MENADVIVNVDVGSKNFATFDDGDIKMGKYVQLCQLGQM